MKVKFLFYIYKQVYAYCASQNKQNCIFAANIKIRANSTQTLTLVAAVEVRSFKL